MIRLPELGFIVQDHHIYFSHQESNLYFLDARLEIIAVTHSIKNSSFDFIFKVP